MDLHPEAEIAAGMVRAGGVLGRVLSWLDRRAYRAADFVVDLGPYMRGRILEKGVEPERVRTIPVWGPAPDRGAASAAPGLRQRLGISDRFLVMYSGNAGVVHDFTDVLEAMRLLRDDDGVYFLFVGDGPRRAEIEEFIKKHQLRNAMYQPYLPREEVPGALAAADVHLITLRGAFAGISVPGKLYGIMGAGRPALFVGPKACETAETIRSAQCGVVVDPTAGNGAREVVAALRAWRKHPEAVVEAGERGRRAYEERYLREINCAAWARVIGDVWPKLAIAAARAPRLAMTPPELSAIS
jgi:glycosyltransferase involved in cell wall biosynthesis